ncbi:Sensor histidine kinase RcsC [Thalassocella blandensis]|nr:Sensor histidine kinase RcsC [Thalassocella blandensis]
MSLKSHMLDAFFRLPNIIPRTAPTLTGLLLTLMLSVTSSLATSAPNQNLQFVRLLVDEGVSIGSVEGIAQDSEGFMWFGGLEGLVRYDGYNYVIFRNHPDDKTSISSNVVWDIFEDSKGVLWIATDGGLNRYNRKTGDFTRFQRDPDTSNYAMNSIASDLTRSIAEDQNGYLWIATYGGLSRFNPERTQFTNYFYDANDINTIQSDDLVKVYIDRSNNVWLGSNTQGLTRYDINLQKFTHYDNLPIAPNGSSHKTIVAIYQDREGYIWLGSDGGGLNRLNPDNGVIKHYAAEPGDPSGLSHYQVLDIVEDANGNLWVATEGGLNLFDRNSDSFNKFVHNPNIRSSLSSTVTRTLFVDNNNDLWIGNFPTGVNFLDTSNMVFKTYRSDPNNPNTLSHSSVLSIEEGADGKLWIGTDGGGLNIFDRKNNTFKHYTHDPNNPKGLSAGAVLSVERDNDNTFWLGTWRGGVDHFFPDSEAFKVYTTHPSEPGHISNENVWSILNDSQENLWLATIGGGLNRFNRHTETFSNYRRQKGLIFEVVWCIFEDSKGRIWIGTGEGLARFDQNRDEFIFYRNDPSNPMSLSFNVVLDIAEDDKQRLWVATRGGGLNLLVNEKTGVFSQFTEQDGLPTDVVNSLETDRRGNFWIGSAKGLTRFNPRTKELIHYNEKNGLQGNQFNIGSSKRLASGEMVFGGTNGFTLFDPAELKLNDYIPPVKIVDFQIFNKPVPIGEENSPLQQTITETKEITLEYYHSVFSFSFAALSYRSPDSNQFAYMMEGFEADWNYVGVDRRNATYTNLNPGTYTFRVKAANNQGFWNEEGTSIVIHILPPWWKTWWAYTIYSLIILGLLWAFVHAQHKKVLNERKINKRLQQLDKLKDEFLANTSHELRTPLNGIIGLAESLVDGVGGTQSEISRSNLEMIISSGKRLERLVNTILDFSKLKEHSLTLHPKPLDMHALTQVVIALSQPSLTGKQLDIINGISKNVPLVNADEDRVQQIMYNLLGNAIKFTKAGKITISASMRDTFLEISIRDTGIGIAEHELAHIFDSFQQVEGSAERTYSGTGLGLAVTRQLVELHGGDISAESQPGQGSRFRFTLPLADDAELQTEMQGSDLLDSNYQTVSASAYATVNAAIESGNTTSSPLEQTPPATETSTEISLLPATQESSVSAQEAQRYHHTQKDHSQFHILVVDDEPVNRQVLLNHLKLQEYRVTPAASGQEALRIINSQHVDLMLLDIMMPNTSGYDVCKTVRQKYSSHELPIIFLTAKTQINDLVTGFSIGSNDFLTKPISRDELLARVNTHLQLLEITRDLEMKVHERTAELQHKHQQLEEAYTQLEQISLSDPLTGLNNRRYLQKLIPMDIAKVQREYDDKKNNRRTKAPSHDLAFFILDVDYFKPVNDHYGHLAGDQLLIQLSELLATVCRESDCLVRWGGEEFLIVSRFSGRDEMPLMAERIRQAVENHTFRLSGGLKLNKTCSIGYACYPFQCDSPASLSWEQVIDTADRALYAAKNSGRNRSVGLAATAHTPTENLYKQISGNITGMISAEEIEVLAQNKDDLTWD